jgi:hypothetical protein
VTDDELAAVIAGIAPAVRAYVATVVGGLTTQAAALDVRVCAFDGTAADVGALRERVAVLETRAPVPGPPGPAGRDGVDGIGYDALTVEQTDADTLTVCAVRGADVRVVGSVAFPVLTFAGDYEHGRAYRPGAVVRHRSALWHCKAATAIAPDAAPIDGTGRPAGPQGRDAWTLLLRDGKRGADGRDGRP